MEAWYILHSLSSVGCIAIPCALLLATGHYVTSKLDGTY